ncbi:ATP-binding cassette domain-containing protein [Kineococcus rubinsiae]|uniref:ATP-binding cassette domain-containing protein n=1 Tax=Kineococcus rubinsiae TaxID=2609562 RepID=UPI00142FA887|nr:ATP-binding cassette domain-containing protein [Kineococcus rubinsiae]NIZ90668.1 sugar ABC transporter ATP-binding protein [Kineococcus rubinsiae]
MTTPTDQPRHDATVEILRLDDVGKSYGNVHALRGVSLSVRQGEITCVLGDNGAGKSTLIKIIAGLHTHSSGQLTVNGEEVHFSSPRESLERGIATVYQDLALVPLMSIWRNFFLGAELTTGSGPFKRLDVKRMVQVADEELTKMGISVPDLERPVGALSGGQRQCIAIARAIYFGAKVLILDEPTAALGVKQSGVVLKYVAKARDAGLGVIFITHNPHHAYLVGNHFVILNRGNVSLDKARQDITLEQLTNEMAGGSELEALSHELSAPGVTPEPATALAAGHRDDER